MEKNRKKNSAKALEANLVCDGENKIEEFLASEGRYLSTTRGISMRPMLKSGRDVIVVEPKKGRLNPLDVALYKRDSAYVLHRVIAVKPNGYLIRGDNTYEDEIVPESAVIGVLTEYFSKGKAVSVTQKRYINYSKRVVKFYPLRRIRVLTWRKIKNLVKMIIRRG